MLCPSIITCKRQNLFFYNYFGVFYECLCNQCVNCVRTVIFYCDATSVHFIMSTDEKGWFSASDLSLLGERLVAGLPKTMSGCMRRAKKEDWVLREVKGSGGKGGMRTEYQPPAPVLALIQSFLDANPDFFAKSKTRTKADLAAISKEVLGDEPRQPIPPHMDDVFKRLKDATDTAIKVGKELNYDSPAWIRLIQELIFSHGLTEAGARRIIETLKQARDTEGDVII